MVYAVSRVGFGSFISEPDQFGAQKTVVQFNALIDPVDLSLATQVSAFGCNGCAALRTIIDLACIQTVG